MQFLCYNAYSTRDSGESDLVFSEDEMYALTNEPSPINSKPPASDPPTLNPVADKEKEVDEGMLKGSLQEGHFALVSWNNMIFPGVVMSINDNDAIVDCMAPTKKAWKWPEKRTFCTTSGAI